MGDCPNCVKNHTYPQCLKFENHLTLRGLLLWGGGGANWDFCLKFHFYLMCSRNCAYREGNVELYNMANTFIVIIHQPAIYRYVLMLMGCSSGGADKTAVCVNSRPMPHITIGVVMC